MTTSNEVRGKGSRARWLGVLLIGAAALAAGGSACATRAPQPPASARAAVAREIDAATAGAYLRDAARAGDVEILEGLVKAGADVESADEKGYTPLILAAYHGHLPAVEALLAAGADACRGDKSGNTALMGATFKGYEEVVERLSRERCTVLQANGAGRTALMFASLVGKTKILQLLESRGADPAARDASGKTAKDWAGTQGVDLR